MDDHFLTLCASFPLTFLWWPTAVWAQKIQVTPFLGPGTNYGPIEDRFFAPREEYSAI